MNRIVAPVRYPLRPSSRATLAEAIALADEHGAELTVLHVDASLSGHRVTQHDLQAAVETVFGHRSDVRFVVRDGFLVEEVILEEVIAADADAVVIGSERGGRLGRLLHRLVGDPDVERYLRTRLRCAVVTVPDRPAVVEH